MEAQSPNTRMSNDPMDDSLFAEDVFSPSSSDSSIPENQYEYLLQENRRMIKVSQQQRFQFAFCLFIFVSQIWTNWIFWVKLKYD